MSQKRVKSQFIKNLRDKDDVASPFLIKYSAVAVGKNGKPYLNLILIDQSGEVEARLWDAVPELASQAVRDAFVWVEGRCQLFQGRRQIVVKSLQALREDEVEISDYQAKGAVDPEALYEELKRLIGSMKDPHYRALAEAVLIEDADVVDRLKRAPAAKAHHHAYIAGLLEHIVSMTGLLDQVAQHYGETLDRDLLFLGSFFHDIAKLWELEYERAIDYTDEGRLVGHLVMGVELIEKKVQHLNDEFLKSGNGARSLFPDEKKLLVKHLVVAHHGRLEYGSPKTPQTLEAWVLHLVDDLDSKVNAIKNFMMQDQSPGKWTALHKNFGSYFLKPAWAMKAQDE